VPEAVVPELPLSTMIAPVDPLVFEEVELLVELEEAVGMV
jgi:hypothetical protein